MAESTEELEPLFDYHRVQPLEIVCLDDDGSDSSPIFSKKRRKLSNSAVEKEGKNGKGIEVIDGKEREEEEEEEEDWLLPPPKAPCDAQKLGEDSTIKELRLKKQELVSSFTQSAGDVLRAVEESVKREFSASLQSTLEMVADKPSKPPCERAKIIISIQDKDELKQFRVYTNDKLERLFKMYADKANLDLQSLVFRFDGDKVSPIATPEGLGMENDDIIEVHVKSS